MSIVIRSMVQQDVEAVSCIEQEAFTMPWSKEEFAKMLERPYSIALVAELEKRVVGYCVLTNICNEGNIDNVAVDEQCRGKGIASALVAEMIVRGEAAGIRAFTLEVRVSNAPAIRVYEKLGFVSEGIRPRFYEKPTEDANIMWRRQPQ